MKSVTLSICCRFSKHNNIHHEQLSFLFCLFQRFSGLSLVLNKEVCDWQRQTLNLSELKGERPAKPDLIHTSCRSESSNISLVVLDKDTEVFILTQATFPNYVIPSGCWLTNIKPIQWLLFCFRKWLFILFTSKLFQIWLSLIGGKRRYFDFVLLCWRTTFGHLAA